MTKFTIPDANEIEREKQEELMEFYQKWIPRIGKEVVRILRDDESSGLDNKVTLLTTREPWGSVNEVQTIRYSVYELSPVGRVVLTVAFKTPGYEQHDSTSRSGVFTLEQFARELTLDRSRAVYDTLANKLRQNQGI